MKEQEGRIVSTIKGLLTQALARTNLSKRKRMCRVTETFYVPPPAVTLRMRLLLVSATNKLPLASTVTPKEL